MQTISAYLLELKDLPQEQVITRLSEISNVAKEWLKEKGASSPEATHGDFKSLTSNGNGHFRRTSTVVGDRILEEVQLEEFAKAGHVFTTTLSMVGSTPKVCVYAKLSITNTGSIIAPLPTDPRCPSVIRKLLSGSNPWVLGNCAVPVPKPSEHNDRESGNALADQILQPERSFPLIVVSQYEGEPIWENLPAELAFDLAGLAYVAFASNEASWSLTERLGKVNSCYFGAVRLYWPVRKLPSGETFVPNTVWTASQLLSNDQDGKGMNRFRGMMRQRIMAVAASTIVLPIEIREIENSAARGKLKELEEKASSHSEELELAKLYVSENEQLKEQLAQAKSEVAQLTYRAEAAESAIAQLKSQQPVQSESSSEEESTPESGEVRYYKKFHSTPKYDVLVRVADCGHTAWQNSAGADKAKKGIERLEGTKNWKGVQHCGSCTGGGMWKVRW